MDLARVGKGLMLMIGFTVALENSMAGSERSYS